MKYYITSTKDSNGKNLVISEREGCPTDSLAVIELPGRATHYVYSKNGKEYPDFKIALAVWVGQITVNEITPAN